MKEQKEPRNLFFKAQTPENPLSGPEEKSAMRRRREVRVVRVGQ